MIINEMAVSRKDFIKLLDSLNRPFMEHIFVIAAYLDNSSVNHWITKLTNWCMKLNDITLKSNKKPESNDFLSYLLTKVDTPNDAKLLGCVHDGKLVDFSDTNAKKFVKNWKELRLLLADSLSSSNSHSRSHYQNLLRRYLL